MFMESAAKLYSGDQGYKVHDPQDYTDNDYDVDASVPKFYFISFTLYF